MKKKKKLIAAIILVLGVIVLSYPFVSQYLYYQASLVTNTNFDNKAKELTDSEIDKRIQLAQFYNEALLTANSITIEDPYKDGAHKQGLAEYARMLEIHEQIGHVEIPKINQDLPIYAGSTEEVLHRGVGHLEGTSLPIGGINTRSVLTAHRGLPTASLFTDLDKMQIGDVFLVHNIKETLAYQVFQIEVIEPYELEKLAIKQDEDIVTLLTCTPYMINTHRLLVHGKRIPYSKEVEVVIASQKTDDYTLYFIAGGIVLLSTVIITWRKKREKK